MKKKLPKNSNLVALPKVLLDSFFASLKSFNIMANTGKTWR